MAAVSDKAKDNQRKYKQDFAKKNYSRVPLDVSKEYHEYLKALAQANGMSLTAFIKLAIEEKAQNAKDEIPAEYITNLKTWLLDHGHTLEDYLDCLQYLGKEKS